MKKVEIWGCQRQADSWGLKRKTSPQRVEGGKIWNERFGEGGKEVVGDLEARKTRNPIAQYLIKS